MKKFESAVVLTTFIGRSLPRTLKRIADFVKEENISTIDTVFTIHSEYNEHTDLWHTSIMSHYQNNKKLVAMVKGKGG